VALSKQTKGLVALERYAEIDSCADLMVQQFESSDIIGMHKSVGSIVRCIKSCNVSTSTRVANKDGVISQTYREEREAFREHFSSLMHGRSMDFKDVVAIDRSNTRDRYGDLELENIWMSIPSFTDVVSFGLDAKVGKAPGENRIIGSVHRVFAIALAYMYYPLVVKTFIRIQPPIQYKGGMIYEIYKLKGAHHLCKSFRDVLLANDSGKHVGKHVRSNLLPRARSLVHKTQFGGGFNGGETSFAHLYVRTVMDSCKYFNMSCGTLFLDVVTAFARMLRRSVFDISEGDEIWLKTLKECGFSDGDVSAIYDTVAALSSWDIDGEGDLSGGGQFCNELSIKVAKHWFTNTWMSQEGLEGVFITDFGCMAGTPLADLVFTVAISRILYVFRKSLHEDQLESSFPVNGIEHIIRDVSFVDDTACPVCAPACDIVQKITAVASVAFRVFKCFKLDLNFAPGKSECVLKLAGAGKKKFARELSSSGNSSSFSAPDGNIICLLFVKTYKHVGTKTPFDSHMGQEVASRCGVMFKTCARLNKPVLGNRRIAIGKRLAILQVYVFTKGMFQASTWPTLDTGTMRRFHHCVLSMYRKVTGHSHGNPYGLEVINDSDVLFEYSLMCPNTFLRLARLSLFARLAVKAPEELLSLLLNLRDVGWSASVVGDLRWITVGEHFSGFGGYSLEDWVVHIRDNPKAFKQRVNKFARTKLANLYECDNPSPKGKMPQSVCSFDCSVCSASFPSFQQYSVHMFKQHQCRNIWRLYVGYGTHCEVCMKQFWSRERLINHIRYRSSICKFNLKLRGPKCSEDEASVIDKTLAGDHVALARVGRRRHFADEPVIRLAGPLLPVVIDPSVKASNHHVLGLGHNHYSG